MPVPQENLYFVEQASCLFRWAYGRALRPNPYSPQKILTKSGTGRKACFLYWCKM
ncbi:hypothetical protein [Microcoleus sp. B13-B6]|uniref:hypothetical protein n=1 Tax=Microcoleus sp. B13-B6 TaxID=2818652 RepID=UPI002FD40999